MVKSMVRFGLRLIYTSRWYIHMRLKKRVFHTTFCKLSSKVCGGATHRLRDEATAHNLEPTVASLGRATVIYTQLQLGSWYQIKLRTPLKTETLPPSRRG